VAIVWNESIHFIPVVITVIGELLKVLQEEPLAPKILFDQIIPTL